MTLIEEIKGRMGEAWLPNLYLQKVRTLRTRAYSLDVPVKENSTEIMYTLLGIELKVGRHRFACPDLATARYIQIFARVGCRDFAVPYDITRISSIADELETSWQHMLLVLSELSPSTPGRVRTQLVKAIRAELEEAGPGELMPEFKQSTKQRGA